MLKFLFSFFLVIPVIVISSEKETITFPAADGLQITADVYITKKEAPFILLFHQAGWSRGEYIEITPKLNDLGFNCLVIDQRSGGSVNEIDNETVKRAGQQKLPTGYLDAYIDMQSALDYLKKKYSKEKVIIWGSSYSAALALKLAAENPDKVSGVLAFSPGEYFVRSGKSNTFISVAVKNLKMPVFITSAKAEKDKWKSIFDSVKSKNKHSFLPDSDGNHGSRALWAKFDDSEKYWQAVIKFLKKYFAES